MLHREEKSFIFIQQIFFFCLGGELEIILSLLEGSYINTHLSLLRGSVH